MEAMGRSESTPARSECADSAWTRLPSVRSSLARRVSPAPAYPAVMIALLEEVAGSHER